ncbi:MAG: pitrilysin family protein [Phycisphaeraceae bacterium]
MIHSRCVFAIAVALSFAARGFAFADSPPSPPSPAPEFTVLNQRSDRLIVELPNRLVVIAQRIPTAPVASVQCWIKTGSIYEAKYNGAGLSHFLEHLLSGGSTTTRTEDQSNAILGDIGAQTNAATSLDNVHYYINTSSEHAATAIDLLSDWMRNAKITQAEFDREREVIQHEFEMGDGEPNRIFWKLTQQARYQAHPARHPTIGYLDEFLKITRDQIHDFYKTMYVPNNMVFVVTGDIDPRKVVEQVANLWKDSPAKPLPAISLPVEPSLDHPTQAAGQADVKLPKLRLAWPGTRMGEEHDYALDLLAQVLGQGELSRLVRTVRNDQRLVTSIDAYNLSFIWGKGFFAVDATPAPGSIETPAPSKPGQSESSSAAPGIPTPGSNNPAPGSIASDKLEAVKQAILAQVHRITAEGVTADELARAKSKTLAAIVMDSQTAEQTASRLAGDFIGSGDPDYLDHYARAIEKISAADVQRAAAAILRDSDLLTLTLLPQTAKPQAMKRVADAAPADSFPQEKVDLDNTRLIAHFKSLQGKTGSVEAPVLSPVTMVKLDNGLRVLIQRDTRLPVVAMQWYQLGGLLADAPGHEGVANASAAMLIKGAGSRSADDIARTLESIGASLSANCGYNTTYVTADCLSQHWPVVLELMADVIEKPAFPADQWAMMKPRIEAAIRTANDRWSTELFSHFHETWFGDHPWSQMPIGRLNVVEKLTPDDLRDFHQQHLSASDSVLAVFGDIDPRKVEDEVRRLFSQLPEKAGKPFVRLQPPSLPGAGTVPGVGMRVTQFTTAKPLCAVAIGYGPGVRRDDPDYAPMLVLTRIVSNFPSGWIHLALRGDGPGLVYAAWASNRVGIIPGYWSIGFNTTADSAVEAVNRSLAVVQRLKAQPVDQTTLTRAVNATLVGESFSQQSDAQRAAGAALDELYGVGYANADHLPDQIRATSAQQLHALANQYLAGQPLITILTNQPVNYPPTIAPAPAPAATQPAAAQ